jgi:hypothetical protein
VPPTLSRRLVVPAAPEHASASYGYRATGAA